MVAGHLHVDLEVEWGCGKSGVCPVHRLLSSGPGYTWSLSARWAVCALVLGQLVAGPQAASLRPGEASPASLTAPGPSLGAFSFPIGWLVSLSPT